MALSALCRRRGDPPAVRRAIGRAQCNDAYWHGVFGGLYLPHLRDADLAQSGRGRGGAAPGQGLAWDVLDLDGDGHEEIWIHSTAFSALVSPARGGAVEEYTIFATASTTPTSSPAGREAYHDLALERRGQQPPR